jgi:hypothetical protein
MTRTEQTLRFLAAHNQWQLLRRGRWMDIHPQTAAAILAGNPL